MKFLRSFAIVAVLAGSAYADTPAPKEAPKTAEKKAPDKAPAKTDTTKPAANELPAADVEKFLAFYNKFVDTVVAAKEDCAKLTKDVNGLIDANQALIKKIQEAKAAKKELPQAAKDKMMGRVKEMMPAMQKCSSDPGFQTAMKRMEGDKAAASTPPPAKVEPAKAPAKTDTTKTAPTTKTDTKPATK